MKALIITGGLVSGAENSVVSSLRKLLKQWRASEHAWLDVKIKLVFAEFLIRKPRVSREDLWAPDLTEVLLATLLEQHGMPYSLATYGDLFDQPRLVEQMLAETDCVFVSTTFLRDLSELAPLLKMLKLGERYRSRHPRRRLWRISDLASCRLDAVWLHNTRTSERWTPCLTRIDTDPV